MSRKKTERELEIELLITRFEKTRDPKHALELMDMVLAEKAKVTARNDDLLLFRPTSKYNSKCLRCKEAYSIGDPIFVQNKKAWHLACATDEERQHPDCARHMKRLQATEEPAETEGEFPKAGETETNNPPLHGMN